LRFAPQGDGPVRVSLGQGYYQTAITESDSVVEMLLDA